MTTPPRSILALSPALAVALALGACSTVAPPVSQGASSLYQSQSAPGARLDKQAAASMISELRHGRGLGPVTLDPALNRMAETQAAAMARTGKLSHDGAAGSFKERIASSGYRNGGMWENIGAGHDTLADAFTGWRSSPPHLKNMLQPGVSRIGVAAVHMPGSRFEVFWALVMADPDDPRPVASAGAADAPTGAQIAARVPSVSVAPGGLMAGSGQP